MSVAVDRRVGAFVRVRDLEYRYNLADLSMSMTCYNKAIQLKSELAKFEITSQYVCCRYLLSDTGLPRELKARALAPEAQHVYLKVLVPETRAWVTVDPTFDSKLKQAGFPVAEWDGLNPTILAVKPFATFSPDRSKLIVEAKMRSAARMDDPAYRQLYAYYEDVNKWIAAQRTSSTGAPPFNSPKGPHA